MIVERGPLRVTLEEDGTLLHVLLARPRGNILDAAMIQALRDVLPDALSGEVRSLLFEGEGPNFSFGASVDEHRPARVRDLLSSFHTLFRGLAASGKVLLAAVRGQCLGGGLELAAFCHRVFAAPDATLSQPEVKLGLFAPVASIVLPIRLGQARADDLLLTGRAVGAQEAHTLGLVDEVCREPAEAARDWHRRHVKPLSGAGLRWAALASRHLLHKALRDDLERIERMYLDDLMATEDALEGIEAFLAKRAAVWLHR